MEELFRSGTLDMSASPLAGLEGSLLPLWGDVLTNRILAVVAVVLLVAALPDLFRLMPHLLFCYDRSRGAVSLQHSLSVARTRDMVAHAFVMAMALVADRFALLDADFLRQVPAGWHAPATIGLVAAFLFVRLLCHLTLRPRRLNGEEAAALKGNLYNYVIPMAVIALMTIGILTLARVPDALIRRVLIGECAVLWAFFLLRSGQILATRCAGFSTILYLCGLEILPTALLTALVVVF